MFLHLFDFQVQHLQDPDKRNVVLLLFGRSVSTLYNLIAPLVEICLSELYSGSPFFKRFVYGFPSWSLKKERTMQHWIPTHISSLTVEALQILVLSSLTSRDIDWQNQQLVCLKHTLVGNMEHMRRYLLRCNVSSWKIRIGWNLYPKRLRFSTVDWCYLTFVASIITRSKVIQKPFWNFDGSTHSWFTINFTILYKTRADTLLIFQEKHIPLTHWL